jgi:hypothetical protein
MAKVTTSGEKCSSACQSTPGCTHFTWTNYQAGTCWMKSGPVMKKDAVVKTNEGAVCGIISSKSVGVIL